MNTRITYPVVASLLLAVCAEPALSQVQARAQAGAQSQAQTPSPSSFKPYKGTLNMTGAIESPGFESDTKYVKMRFAEEKLQILDGRQLQIDEPGNPNDDLATRTERVMLEFAGENGAVLLFSQ